MVFGIDISSNNRLIAFFKHLSNVQSSHHNQKSKKKIGWNRPWPVCTWYKPFDEQNNLRWKEYSLLQTGSVVFVLDIKKSTSHWIRKCIHQWIIHCSAKTFLPQKERLLRMENFLIHDMKYCYTIKFFTLSVINIFDQFKMKKIYTTELVTK